MRKIIFKGKSKDGNEWIEGDLIQRSENEVLIMTQNERCWDVLYDGVEVIPETVCQYTGLKDCNNVMIFDYDIRKDNEGTEFRIYRTFGGFVIKAKYWMSDIKNLVSGDELIFKSLSDPQLSDWIINDTTHVRNIHD